MGEAVPGEVQLWRPLEGGGFERLEDVRAAGEHVEFDLADLDLAALAGNLRRAEETLGVPEPAEPTLAVQQHVEERRPRVVIGMDNEFGEHGYLVTDLSGKILERSPFDPSRR